MLPERVVLASRARTCARDPAESAALRVRDPTRAAIEAALSGELFIGDD